MKRKFLEIIVGIYIILMVFLLTGCSNTQTISENEIQSGNEQIEEVTSGEDFIKLIAQYVNNGEYDKIESSIDYIGYCGINLSSRIIRDPDEEIEPYNYESKYEEAEKIINDNYEEKEYLEALKRGFKRLHNYVPDKIDNIQLEILEIENIGKKLGIENDKMLSLYNVEMNVSITYKGNTEKAIIDEEVFVIKKDGNYYLAKSDFFMPIDLANEFGEKFEKVLEEFPDMTEKELFETRYEWPILYSIKEKGINHDVNKMFKGIQEDYKNSGSNGNIFSEEYINKENLEKNMFSSDFEAQNINFENYSNYDRAYIEVYYKDLEFKIVVTTFTEDEVSFYFLNR